MATTEELEVTAEIVCTNLPGEDWEGNQPLHLGIQQDQQMIEAASAGSKRVVFKPLLRARRNPDGSTEKAATRKKPIRVTVALTNAKGKPVFASVRPDVAKWDLD